MTEHTSTDITPRVFAYALHALADHIAGHALPVPAEMQLDEESRRLEIHLSLTDSDRWVASLPLTCVDDFDVQAAVRGGLVEWVTVQARLPETGVRIQLQWCRMARKAAS